MNERVEAAAKANYEAVTGTPWVSAPKLTAKLCRRASATIIAAADAVMFSDEAVERAAKVLRERCEDPGAVTGLGGYTGDVLSVIAALKGDDA